MPKFRKKPVVIEAVRYRGTDSGGEAWKWSRDRNGPRRVAMGTDERGHFILIETLEGTMRAYEGDWIIQGVNGELYPCKPDIFAATYEPALIGPRNDPAGS